MEIALDAVSLTKISGIEYGIKLNVGGNSSKRKLLRVIAE